MDGSGTRVVEYTYDAWGKLISTSGSLASTLGADNPFRYRGYYYDTETGLYYLMTRYYDPEVGRFLSADVYLSTGQGVLGGNMWAYCLNNPILYSDTFGESVTICILGVTFSLVELVVAVAAIVIVADVLINGENSLLARAASSVVEAVEIAAETNAEIWKAVEAVITHPERFTTGSGIIVGSGTLIGSIISIVEDKKDPDPYARPGQKKQNREVKEKKRKKDNFKSRSGKRRIQPPKKHTPGREHQKY